MKYIKEYQFEEFEELNEKVTFKDIAFYFIVLYSFHHFGGRVLRDYKTYKEVNKIFSIVNSTTNLPEGEDKIFIENLKKDIILQVKNSNLFDKFGKNYILDSLQNITIKVAMPTGKLIIKENTAAIFIKLSEVEKIMKKSKFSNSSIHSKKNNVIIINERYIKDKDLSTILTHEIYHYVDALLSSNNSYISSELALSNLIDKNLDNKDHSVSKLAFIFSNHPDNFETRNLIKKLSSSILKSSKYLSSDEEIFARWKTLKIKMINDGYIKNMNVKINKYMLLDYLSKNKPDYLNTEFLLFIDFDKIEELDSKTI